MGRFSDLMIDIEERLFDGATPVEIASALGITVEMVEQQIEAIETYYEEDDGQPSSYEEYQDLPWGGDDAFETCSYCEDY